MGRVEGKVALVTGGALAAGPTPTRLGATLPACTHSGHLGEQDDIAYGVPCLASDESKFMTGSALVIDGGYTAQ